MEEPSTRNPSSFGEVSDYDDNFEGNQSSSYKPVIHKQLLQEKAKRWVSMAMKKFGQRRQFGYVEA